MKIAVSGASGYLGGELASALKNKGHEVLKLTRSDLYSPLGTLAGKISGTEAVVNLAGAPVLKRWSLKAKKEIYESRVLTTKNIIEALKILPHEKQPKKFISASAVGIYQPGIIHDEESKVFSDNFLGGVVKNWENASANLDGQIQRIIFRLGLVIDKDAKVIKKQLLPFKLGFGATIGSGLQPFPFVHIGDVVKAFTWAIENYQQSGVFNLAAPQNINNKTFAKIFAKKLNRHCFLSIPPFILKIVYGKASVILSESPAVNSNKIIGAGFFFNYPDINSALDEILS